MSLCIFSLLQLPLLYSMLQNLSGPFRLVGSVRSALLPSSTAVFFFCAEVHADACESAIGCRPHPAVISRACCAFGDIAAFLRELVPFVWAIVRRARCTWASPVDLGSYSGGRNTLSENRYG